MFQEYLVKKILQEEGYNLSDHEISMLIEAGFLDKVGKWGRNAALAATLGAAMPSMANAEIRQSVPSRNQASIKQVVPSQYSSGSINSFWKQIGSTYMPINGNGVLVKHNTNVRNDDLTDNTQDFAPIQVQQPFKRVNAEGNGANLDEAIKDALRNAVSYAAGVNVDSETNVKSKTSVNGNNVNSFDNVDDRVTTGGEGVVGKFMIKGTNSSNGIVTVTIQAEAQIRTGKASGWENFRKLDDKGKFRLYKQSL